MENFMSIVKTEINVPEAVSALQKFKANRRKAFEDLSSDIRISVELVINELLNTEMNIYLGEADQEKRLLYQGYWRNFTENAPGQKKWL